MISHVEKGGCMFFSRFAAKCHSTNFENVTAKVLCDPAFNKLAYIIMSIP